MTKELNPLCCREFTLLAASRHHCRKPPCPVPVGAT
uniref:Uncharacterized protein n=1 Tax=Arundo donax TaxID=35708 RepID=A0A0A9BJS8_ARUDO